MDTLTQEIRALRDQIEALQFKQDLPQLMTPAQCAEFLQRSEEVLYLWRKERSGPPYLHITSRTVLYDRDDVLEWARSHRVQ
ncbi:MAG: helix-turn-helix domain-containing protein [Roseicyclus sp.]|nr:helix-turn-helix domain-containing protein [Roseicyclus sp.]MBO6626262.1 helix-turn-helix domain-containing protein [Roseicyclus sp.]MBO6923947.1 helix-turn-helix domain-containing protein [Roseicyclus sp.]